MKTTNLLSILSGVILLIVTSSFNVIPKSESPFALIGLQVTVLDEKGNVVKGADVVLYSNEDDAFDETNGIKAKTKTNENGRVKFTKGLKEISYYIVATKGDMRSEDDLKSSKLKKNKMNKVNVIISKGNGMSMPKVTGGKKQ
ncbi:carboxypeptidase-like regulatory domain-containing protein [Flammeovirga sp. EKP202]|uniref:carboxypeptidase-like regulatory domain-containing protein n=1 Tax=Flammeovirga sp. EKP202 TaxID=2770592 RepID=UPI00165FEF83|nr:carboxypeptidase-like regulatory domain-containing protein [Flammeovirga sp. EKP202]MBD0404729.1 carboxypeptidase regulatory-like domain-containing protein [Flammeovirga sp. EKP202]